MVMTMLKPDVRDPSQARRAILLVENDEVLREVLSEALHYLGYLVYSAASGEEALTIAGQVEEISLVISDLVMPRMNALQLYEALDTGSYRGRMLVITGYPMPQTGASLTIKSGVRWASKPIGMDELQRVVREMLAG
jgi:CheY-like chemotaxis protein